MQIAGIRIRRRVFVSMGLVVAVTGAWVYWSRANQPKNTPVAEIEEDGWDDCVWQVILAHFGSLFWPTLWADGFRPGR